MRRWTLPLMASTLVLSAVLASPAMAEDQTLEAVSSSPPLDERATALAPGEITTAPPAELRIRRFYLAVLDREPEEAGLAYWFALLTTGTDAQVIADSFARSEEFRARFGVPDGPAGDAAFVERVYRNVLGRQPDASGLRYWNRVLEAGAERSHIVLWFSESEEFIGRTGLASPALPPFESEIRPIDAADLGVSWRDGCPVGPDDLRLLRLTHLGFDGRATTGEIVVRADVATSVVAVFERLYESRYPIQSMRTIDEFDGSDDASMEANNTSAFNCRRAVFSTSWSRHAYGTAIDINPLVNPYIRGDTVLPPGGDLYLDRRTYHPAVIREGDAVTEAFDAIGWYWGGRWTSTRDYQHFSSDNR